MCFWRHGMSAACGRGGVTVCNSAGQHSMLSCYRSGDWPRCVAVQLMLSPRSSAHSPQAILIAALRERPKAALLWQLCVHVSCCVATDLYSSRLRQAPYFHTGLSRLKRVWAIRRRCVRISFSFVYSLLLSLTSRRKHLCRVRRRNCQTVRSYCARCWTRMLFSSLIHLSPLYSYLCRHLLVVCVVHLTPGSPRRRHAGFCGGTRSLCLLCRATCVRLLFPVWLPCPLSVIYFMCRRL